MYLRRRIFGLDWHMILGQLDSNLERKNTVALDFDDHFPLPRTNFKIRAELTNMTQVSAMGLVAFHWITYSRPSS